MTKFISPLSWPGGKAKVFNKIEKYFPLNFSKYTFIDGFSGGGSVALNVANKYKNENIVINDIDIDLIKFWNYVKLKETNVFDDLLLHFISNKTETNRLFLVEFCKKDNNCWPEEVKFFARNKLSFNSQPYGTFTNLRYKQNLTLGVINRIKICNKLLKNINLQNLDVFDLITKFDADNAVFYFDPPYYKIKCLYKYNFQEWNKFFEILSNLKSKFILSLNNHSDILEFCKLYNFLVYNENWKYTSTNNTGKNASIKKEKINNTTELIITNFKNE